MRVALAHLFPLVTAKCSLSLCWKVHKQILARLSLLSFWDQCTQLGFGQQGFASCEFFLLSGCYVLLLHGTCHHVVQESEKPSEERSHPSGSRSHTRVLCLLAAQQHHLAVKDSHGPGTHDRHHLWVNECPQPGGCCDKESGYLPLLPQPIPLRVCWGAVSQWAFAPFVSYWLWPLLLTFHQSSGLQRTVCFWWNNIEQHNHVLIGSSDLARGQKCYNLHLHIGPVWVGNRLKNVTPKTLAMAIKLPTQGVSNQSPRELLSTSF